MTTPLWLTAPTRFATLKPSHARIALALLAVLLLATLLALTSPGPPPVSHDPDKRADDQADVMLYEDIVRGVRGGGDYYVVAAQAQRAGGYPMRPFVTMRLPTLARVQAMLPRTVMLVLLYALAAGVLFAWYVRFRTAFARPAPLIIALLLAACGGLVFLRADLVGFHEIWAGLLIALSLAIWRPERWIEAVAIATCAMLIRETAALYAIVMAVAALMSGARREALGWGVGLSALAVAVGFHYWAWSQVVLPADGAGPGWAGLLGFGFFVKAVILLTAFAALPIGVAAPLLGLALFGWSCWSDPTAKRALATFATFAVLIALFCRVDTYYWGLLVAPVILAGLAFAPDGLRDAIGAARRRGRITVTRLVR